MPHQILSSSDISIPKKCYSSAYQYKNNDQRSFHSKSNQDNANASSQIMLNLSHLKRNQESKKVECNAFLQTEEPKILRNSASQESDEEAAATALLMASTDGSKKTERLKLKEVQAVFRKKRLHQSSVTSNSNRGSFDQDHPCIVSTNSTSSFTLNSQSNSDEYITRHSRANSWSEFKHEINGVSSYMNSTPREVFISSSSDNQSSDHIESFSKFPCILHKILTNSEYAGNVIEWLPDGNAWKILKWDEFLKILIPNCFPYLNGDINMNDERKISSSINGIRSHLKTWGFEEVKEQGSDLSCYHHALFTRGNPELCNRMIFNVKENIFRNESSTAFRPLGGQSLCIDKNRTGQIPQLTGLQVPVLHSPEDSPAFHRKLSHALPGRLSQPITFRTKRKAATSPERVRANSQTLPFYFTKNEGINGCDASQYCTPDTGPSSPPNMNRYRSQMFKLASSQNFNYDSPNIGTPVILSNSSNAQQYENGVDDNKNMLKNPVDMSISYQTPTDQTNRDDDCPPPPPFRCGHGKLRRIHNADIPSSALTKAPRACFSVSNRGRGGNRHVRALAIKQQKSFDHVYRSNNSPYDQMQVFKDLSSNLGINGKIIRPALSYDSTTMLQRSIIQKNGLYGQVLSKK